MTTHHTNPLTWRIFVAPPEPIVGDDLEPGQSRRTRSRISATLISGERDAVLVDPLLSFKQGHALAGLVVATGKNLTPCISPMVMATTGWGLDVIRQRIPHVRAVAVPAVVEHMRLQASPESPTRRLPQPHGSVRAAIDQLLVGACEAIQILAC